MDMVCRIVNIIFALQMSVLLRYGRDIIQQVKSPFYHPVRIPTIQQSTRTSVQIDSSTTSQYRGLTIATAFRPVCQLTSWHGYNQ